MVITTFNALSPIIKRDVVNRALLIVDNNTAYVGFRGKKMINNGYSTDRKHMLGKIRINRRKLLVSTIGLTLTVLLTGCATKADYNYFQDAKRLGNNGFDAVLQGNDNAAKTQFQQSTQTLSTGVYQHTQKAKKRAGWQSGLNTIATVGAAVGMSYMAADASRQVQSQAQLNQINSSISQFGQGLGNLNLMIERQIRETERSIVDPRTRDVDLNVWRAAVISDHPIAQSIVRLRTSGGLCTGFYIQPRVVATAAHCFSERARVEVHHEVTSAGDRFMRGESVVNPVLYQIRHPLYDNNPNCMYRDNAGGCIPYDVAFLVTRDASAHFLPLYTEPPSTGLKIFNVGYSGDLNSGFFKRIDYGCHINSVAQGHESVIGYDCDSYGGNSGGPVVAVIPSMSGQSIGVIGVHSTGSRELESRVENRSGSAHLGSGRDIYRTIVSASPGAGRLDLLDRL